MFSFRNHINHTPPPGLPPLRCSPCRRRCAPLFQRDGVRWLHGLHCFLCRKGQHRWSLIRLLLACQRRLGPSSLFRDMVRRRSDHSLPSVSLPPAERLHALQHAGRSPFSLNMTLISFSFSSASDARSASNASLIFLIGLSSCSLLYHFIFLYIELVILFLPTCAFLARLLWRPYFLSAECAYPIKRAHGLPGGLFVTGTFY